MSVIALIRRIGPALFCGTGVLVRPEIPADEDVRRTNA